MWCDLVVVSRPPPPAAPWRVPSCLLAPLCPALRPSICSQRAGLAKSGLCLQTALPMSTSVGPHCPIPRFTHSLPQIRAPQEASVFGGSRWGLPEGWRELGALGLTWPELGQAAGWRVLSVHRTRAVPTASFCPQSPSHWQAPDLSTNEPPDPSSSTPAPPPTLSMTKGTSHQAHYSWADCGLGPKGCWGGGRGGQG